MLPNRCVELHDSELLASGQADGDLILELALYVHASAGRPTVDAGEGWMQDAVLTVANGHFVEGPPDGELVVLEGSLLLGAKRYENTVPLPLEFTGPIELVVEGGEGRCVVRGDGASLEFIGAPEFIELFEP